LKVVTESSKIEKGDEFLNDIVSSLPYCEATSEKRYGYHEILIDDERIVGITVGALLYDETCSKWSRLLM